MISFNNLNLEHRTDRKYMLFGNYQTLGISIEDVIIHKAPHGLDYETSATMGDAAIKDGYPIFDCDYLRKQPRGDIGYLWGTLRILESIRDCQEYSYGYYNQDDNVLLLKAHELYEICMTLTHDFNEDFLFLQLRWSRFNDVDHEEIWVCPDLKIMKGALGRGDSGLLMSKSGADYIITEFLKEPDAFEDLIAGMWGVPGIYSRSKDAEGTNVVDTRWFGHERYKDDQDRIQINKEDV